MRNNSSRIHTTAGLHLNRLQRIRIRLFRGLGYILLTLTLIGILSLVLRLSHLLLVSIISPQIVLPLMCLLPIIMVGVLTLIWVVADDWKPLASLAMNLMLLCTFLLTVRILIDSQLYYLLLPQVLLICGAVSIKYACWVR